MADRSAFDDFVHARGPALARTAYLLTVDHHLVRRSLYNQNVSWWRRRRVAESPLGSYDTPSPAGDPTTRLTLEQALRRLTVKQRTVLVLRYFEDLTEVQAAEVLDISPGTVKSTTRQALGRLRVLASELADLVGADS